MRTQPTHDERGPEIRGRLTRKRISRTNDCVQAGRRCLLLEEWERDDLVAALVGRLSHCDRAVCERMVWHFVLVENGLGLRVGEGPGIAPHDVAGLRRLAGRAWRMTTAGAWRHWARTRRAMSGARR